MSHGQAAAGKLTGKELESVLWSYARLRLTPSPEVVEAVMRRAEETASTLTPAQICTVLWALAVLHLSPNPSLAEVL
jgi:hypothetical protein